MLVKMQFKKDFNHAGFSRLINETLKQKLLERKEQGLLRSLNDYSSFVDFLSNDYLGLASLTMHHSMNGSGGSRLIFGNSTVIQEAERDLAMFFGFESALCFNSGYDANLAIFSTIPQRADVVLYDREIHASVRDGLRLGIAANYSFVHNDVNDLRLKLQQHQGKRIFIAIEGLYSMSGDIAPLLEIKRLAIEFNARVIIDEAHSCGVYGEQGKGLADGEVFIKLVTFGKAYGGHGACVLCDRVVQEYLINFSRTFIYTTALPEGVYQRMAEIVRIESIQKEVEVLRSRILQFRKQVSNDQLLSHEHSPIQIIRSKESLKAIENRLLEEGIAAKVMLPPTVEKEKECLRICIHSFNTPEEINRLTAVLEK